MWSQRDPSLRRSGFGNIFVKNLPSEWDNKTLYDTFSAYGNILSCKVAANEGNKSKSYGYVHYETDEAAEEAIKKLDGVTIDDCTLNVVKFVKRQDRAGHNNWTNLYIKHFPDTWDENKINELFSKFGTIVNVALAKDEEGRNKGFAFLNYQDHEAAAKAVEEMNDKVLDENQEGKKPLYVSRAQKKTERSREIKQKLETLAQERNSKYQGMNLYVKNIADSVSDDKFREAFAKFGTITSARIMREDNEAKTSKGFGFVCFSSVEEATKALNEMNGKPFEGKPLVVNLHQRKEQRKAHLAATYSQNMGYPQVMQQGIPMQFVNMYMNPGQPGYPRPPAQGVPPYNFPGNPMAGGRGGMHPRGMPYNGPRGPMYNQNMPNYMQPMSGNQGPNQQGGPMKPRPNNANFPMNNPQMQQGMPQQMGPGQGMPRRGGPMPTNMPRGPMGMPGAPAGPRGAPAYPGMQAPMGAQPSASPAQQPKGVKKGIDTSALANMNPSEAKNAIGEALYPLIAKIDNQRAGKITGMLLEMDNGELINLLESSEALDSKVREAIDVLEKHKQVEAH